MLQHVSTPFFNSLATAVIMRNLKIISILLLSASSACRLYRRHEDGFGDYRAQLEEVNKYMPAAIDCYQDFLHRVEERRPPRQEALDSIYACDKDYNLTTKALNDAGKLALSYGALADKLFENKLPDVTDRRTSGQGAYTQKLQESRDQLAKVAYEAGEAFKNGTEALKKVMDVFNDFPDVLSNETLRTTGERVARSIDISNASVSITKNSDGLLEGVVVGLSIAGVAITVGVMTVQSFLVASDSAAQALELATMAVDRLSMAMSEIEAVEVRLLTVRQIEQAKGCLVEAGERVSEAMNNVVGASLQLESVPGRQFLEAHSIYSAQYRKLSDVFNQVLGSILRYHRLRDEVTGLITI
ncbi:hypothetical protein L249_5665 [Ophiocordyceps polyrhachis-furcata BCC 54312]|uniref:Uncharacterized protein n=1 Tax=Ophiocordyceps polyrhachis-furcata BCC 54312 TaxID=1330021 RepID=A0A367L042_9HYPO|nr:hypothetical protein L249_5665 [Ophiocordyceps polyrhachis-furcata BCC 54312]